MPVLPSRPKGPPLNALRAFEAAARLNGFLAASEELGVTPGAVSQQIKSLEEWVGAPLFTRRAQGVQLTALGKDVVEDFSYAFDAMGDAVRRLRAGSTQNTLAIAALPSVAQLWLAPRMPALRAALPGCDISITAVETRPNLSREMFDLSLFVDAPTGRSREIVLQRDELCPVCAPDVAATIRGVADLRNQIWIFDAAWQADWAQWIAGVAPEMAVKPGPRHSLYSIAVADAESGAGVLIGHSCLVETALKRGTLVAPLAFKEASGLSLNLETAPGVAHGVIDLFRGLVFAA